MNAAVMIAAVVGSVACVYVHWVLKSHGDRNARVREKGFSSVFTFSLHTPFVHCRAGIGCGDGYVFVLL